MSDIETTPISSSFQLMVAPEEQEPFPEEVEQQVNEVWDHCKEITDWDLFDGKVFQHLKFSKTTGFTEISSVTAIFTRSIAIRSSKRKSISF